MKLFTLATTVVAASLLCFPAAAAADSPSSSVVRRAKIDVFSGPGEQYYRTGVLTEGTRVDVYRKAGGFVGIRPPEGSFSWAPGADLKETEPGVAVVMRDGVPSRVGSLLSSERNVVHVRLKRGERVRVVSRMMIDGAEWAQIAPPAGEFRWVRAADVADLGDGAPVFDPPPAETAAPADFGSTSPAAPTMQELPEPAPFVPPAEDVSDWVQPVAHAATATEPPASETPAPATLTEAPPFAPAALAPTPPPAVTTATAPPAATATNLPTAAPAASDPFARRLVALELELSRRVVEPPSQWRLDDVRAAAAQLLSSTRDPQQLAAARSFAQRTEHFASLGQRSRQLPPGNAFAGQPRAIQSRPVQPRTVQPLASAPVMQPITPISSEVRGELRAVVAKRPDAPKFALVDGTGAVITFVTPQPGMDLQPLVGKQVVASGTSGLLTAAGRRHLSATRVAQAPTTVR